MVTLLQREIVAELGWNLEGLYLKGSLALGDFNPETSDIDLLALVKEPLAAEEFTRLARRHARIHSLPHRYAKEVELAYVPVGDVQRFQSGKAYPALERGERLKWKPLGANWILEFWTVRERGGVLYGPDPKALIPPISPAEVRAAVRRVLAQDWLEWVATWQEPGWQTQAGEMRFVVETMCRALYTGRSGRLISKPKAVEWALEAWPQPWSGLVRQSQAWRAGGKVEPSVCAQVARLVGWTQQQLARGGLDVQGPTP